MRCTLVFLILASRFRTYGSRLNIKIVFPMYGIPIFKMRRSGGHLIYKMGIPILVRRHLYIKTAPWCLPQSGTRQKYLRKHQSTLSLALCEGRHSPHNGLAIWRAFYAITSIPHNYCCAVSIVFNEMKSFNCEIYVHWVKYLKYLRNIVKM